MEELYLLDKNRKVKHIIDTYSSVIWASRYNTVGDCEVVIAASFENLKKIKESRYIVRDDDDMVCEIEKIEIKTDIENGNQFIIYGTDVKKILKQRIVAKQINFNGLVEDYIRTLINESIIEPIDEDRKIDNFILGEKQGFTETIKQQTTYDNVGEKIEEICKQYGWGYKIILNNEQFVFLLYKGKDLSEYISFTESNDNISTTEYLEDNKNVKNVALVAGEGEGANRTTVTVGEGKGIDRHELYVDSRDVSSAINYDELIKSYPGGTIKKIDGKSYYQVNGENIAIITYYENSEDSQDITDCILLSDVYTESLKSEGYEALAGCISAISFSGTVIVNCGYTYKMDYNLGDIVNVESEYGISINIRITEIVESKDGNGYTIMPTFDFKNE